VLSQAFSKAAFQYTRDQGLVDKLWAEIETAYSSRKRCYHNLNHLDHLFRTLTEVQNMLQDVNIIIFSIAYHDIVYNTLKSNNEEKSASLAHKRLTSMGCPSQQIEICVEQILATKHHQPSPNSDTNYFTDADLSILGEPEDAYLDYCQKIRKEYSLYPDLVYKPGRRKVIEHFLAMEKIFKTNEFRNRYENQARKNLFQELKNLS
jgi:predicted metal-dependent HD superfamily phosphohydrolase